MISKDKILDSLLVVEARSGSRKAMSILVKRWHPKVCRQANWYLNDLELSKDLAQDTWKVVVAKLNSLEDPNKFGSWILTIVRRKALDQLRKQKTLHQKIERYDSNTTTSNFTDNASSNHALIVLQEAIRTLSVQKQQILNLYYLENFDVKRISEIINIPVGTVKSRLFGARKELKTILKNRNYER